MAQQNAERGFWRHRDEHRSGGRRYGAEARIAPVGGSGSPTDDDEEDDTSTTDDGSGSTASGLSEPDNTTDTTDTSTDDDSTSTDDSTTTTTTSDDTDTTDDTTTDTTDTSDGGSEDTASGFSLPGFGGGGDVAGPDIEAYGITADPSTVEVGGTVTVTVEAINAGGQGGDYNTSVTANGSSIGFVSWLNIEPGDVVSETVTWSPLESGSYTISAGDESTSVTVEPSTDSSGGSRRSSGSDTTDDTSDETTGATSGSGDVLMYNGRPRSEWEYTGAEPDLYEQWVAGEISTSEFQSRTIPGQGTAALSSPTEGPTDPDTGEEVRAGISDVSFSVDPAATQDPPNQQRVYKNFEPGERIQITSVTVASEAVANVSIPVYVKDAVQGGSWGQVGSFTVPGDTADLSFSPNFSFTAPGTDFLVRVGGSDSGVTTEFSQVITRPSDDDPLLGGGGGSTGGDTGGTTGGDTGDTTDGTTGGRRDSGTGDDTTDGTTGGDTGDDTTGGRRGSGTPDSDEPTQPRDGVPYIGPLTVDNPRAVGAGLAAALGTGLLLSR